jgi:hypothetical protein
MALMTGSDPRNKIPELKHEVFFGTSMLKSMREGKLMALSETEDNIITMDCFECFGTDHKLWTFWGHGRIFALPLHILQT